MAKKKIKPQRQAHKKRKKSSTGGQSSVKSVTAVADDDFATLFRHGTELLHQGKNEQAISLLERAYELEPLHINTAINLGGAYILTKRFRKAVTILEPLSQREAEHVMVWTNLGAAYLGNPVLARSEEQLKAIAAFQKALEINPIVPNVAYNIGLIYRDRQELEKATFWFEQAIKHDPSDQDARNLLEKLQLSMDPNNDNL